MPKKNRIEKSAAEKEKYSKRFGAKGMSKQKYGKEMMKSNKLSKKLIEDDGSYKQEQGKDRTKEQIVTDTVNFWNSGVSASTQDWKRAKENIGLVFDEHWDGTDVANHILDERTPLNMPGVFSKVQTLHGWEKNNREQFEGDAKGKEDELTAELANRTFRHIESNDDPKKYQYTKSDVFFDGTVPYCGCVEIYVETNELGENEIKLRQLDYNEVVFERNFTDVEMTGCARMAHGREVYIDELKVQYGNDSDLLAEIEKIPSEYMVEDKSPQVTEDVKQLVDMGDPKRKKVMKLRDWKLVNRVCYELHCIADDKIEEYYDEAEAKERRQVLMDQKRTSMKQERDQLQSAEAELATAPPEIAASVNIPELQYMLDGMVMSDAEIEQYLEEDYIIKQVPKRLVEHTVVAGNVVLEMPHLLEVDEMPLTFYFSIMLKGRIITIIDVVRHLQQYFDKQFAQMDHDIGHDTKTTKVLYKELIDEDYQSIEEAIDALTDGKVIVAKGTPAQGNPVQTIQRSGVSRDVFPVFELLLQLMEDSFGGRNFQGAQETGGQSGKAIAKLQAAAALIALNYMDNLRRFDMQVGKKLLKFVKKFYTHKYSLKVLGESMTAEIMNALQANGMYERSAIESGWGWITVNDPDNPKSRPISEANLNIEVNRVSVRQDEKDVEFEKLMGLKSQGYAVPVECVLDTLNLKATLKQKIIKENEKKEELQLRQLALAEKQAELDANMKVAGFTKPQVEAQMSSENGKQKREASVASGE